MAIDFEFQDCGVDHAQYFPGIGTAFTDWDDVFVGVGDTFAEAFDDAIEMCCQATDVDGDVFPSVDTWLKDTFGWTRAEMPQVDADCHDDCEEGDHDECELHHYVALFIRERSEE